MRYSPIFLLFVLLFQTYDVQAQYYNTGQDPPSLKWMKVSGEKFDVIYPESYGDNGLNFARLLDSSYANLAPLFKPRKQRMPVVIHNYSTNANGYVAWAPRRMELYPAPDQMAIPGNQHWLLSVHETTHIYEMEALKRGFSGIMSIFLGEQFTGAVTAMLPLWYLEGNAVFTETLLSESGRGRNPSFQQELKAIAVDKGNFKYDKILNGSFREHVPDHYKSGYQMTTWAMVNYDQEIWNKVLKSTATEPFTLNPVNISLKRNIGLTKKKLYKETFDMLKGIWTEEISDAVNYDMLNPLKHGKYISYQTPVITGKDSIIAIRTSLSSTPAIVLISAGKEKVLHRTGYVYPLHISSGGRKVLWVEERPDLRWANRNYKVIRILDLSNGRIRNVLNRTRYLSASISPDGKLIAAIENTPENHTNLVLIDSKKRTVLRSIPSPDNLDINRPQWSDDNTIITVIKITDKGEGILAYNLTNNSWKTLLKEGSADLQSSFLRNDTLFFVSASSGTDNIWIGTGNEIHQITNSKFGVSDVSASGNKIIFSDYSSVGNNICTTSANLRFLIEPTRNRSDIIEKFEKSDTYANGEPISLKGDYTVTSYRKWQHLFRFHSWMPFYADIDEIQSDPLSIRPGVTLMSQNTLSTLFTTLGYEYTSDRRHIIRSEMSYHGIYPVLTASIDYGYKPSVLAPANITVPLGTRFRGGVSFPFSFSSGYLSHYLRFSLDGDYSNNIYPISERVFDYGQTNLTARAYFVNYSRRAYRDIYPRFSQTIDVARIFAPFDKELFGSSTMLRSSFTFPGLLKNHGLRIKYEREIQQQSNFLFTNRISFPRGYSDIAYPEGYNNIISKNLAAASADYAMPLLYPDFNIASLLYVKRIRSSLFYDYAWGKGNRYYGINEQGRLVLLANNDYTETFSSYGAELIADFHILRIPFMISGGVQAAWRSTHELPVLKAIFSMDLYGFSLGR